MHKSLAALSLATCFSVVAACGGGQPEPVAPEPAPPAPPATAEPAPAPEPAPEPAPPEPEAPKTFADMNHDQRVEHMKTVVMPKMSAVFQEFNAKKYEKFGCATCHGEGAKEGKFDMPNPKLPTLDPKNGFAKHMKKDPKDTKFMMEKVVPAMAEAMMSKPFDPATGEGFGCAKCHQMVQ